MFHWRKQSNWKMENEQFHSDIDRMFESYLGRGEKPILRIAKNGVVNTKMPYDKVVFDSDLNIYKKNADGTLERVTDPQFSVVVISAEQPVARTSS